MFKIDVHMHLAGTGCCQSGCSVSPTFQSRLTFRLIKILQGLKTQQMTTTVDRDWVQLAENLVAQSQIDLGVALGFDGVYDHGSGNMNAQKSQMIVPASWVFQAAQNSSHLLPGPSINPHRKDALDTLDYCIEMGAVLIKWLPATQAINASDQNHRRFYQKLADSKIPLLVHMGGERTFAEIAPEYNDIEKIVAPLDQGVKVICAHSASKILGAKEPDHLPRLKSLLQSYANLFVDNSGLCNPARFAHVPRLAQDPLISSRTLYGSDWPVPSNALYFLPQMGWRQTVAFERIKNLIDRDIAIKRFFGYDDQTLTRANGVLHNIDRWAHRPHG